MHHKQQGPESKTIHLLCVFARLNGLGARSRAAFRVNEGSVVKDSVGLLYCTAQKRFANYGLGAPCENVQREEEGRGERVDRHSV